MSFSKGDIQLTLSSPHADEHISPEFEEYLDKKRAEIEAEAKNGNLHTAYSGKNIIDAARNFKDDEEN